MSNKLIKSSLVSYIPGSPYVPAFAGQPWIPAHWATDTQIVCRYRPASGMAGDVIGGAGHWEIIQDPTSHNANAQPVMRWVGPAPASGTPGYTWACLPESYSYWVDAQPYLPPTPPHAAVPAQVITDYNLGWNASARSINDLHIDGYIAFDGPAADIGALVGMQRADVVVGYTSLDHALSFAHGATYVVERGTTLSALGTTVSTDRWAIHRHNGVVTYRKNGTVVYTSSLAAATTPVYLAAVLYSGGDFVDNPLLADTPTGTVDLQPLSIYAGVGTMHASATFSFAPMTVSGRSAVGAALSFLPLTCFASDRPIAQAALSFAPMTVSGEGGLPVPAFALAAFSLGYLSAGGTSLTGETGGGNLVFAPLEARGSDHNYGDARLTFAPLLVGGSAYEGNNNATVFSTLSAFDAYTAQNEVYVVWSEALNFATLFTVTRELSAEVVSQLTLTDALSAVYEQLALMRSTLTFSGTVPVFDGSAQTWVVNADTGAASRYEGYDFNSFGCYGGQYFGVKSDGLYFLDGADDAGQDIRASLSFGKQDFGTSALKRLANAYIGVSSTGTMWLKIVANDTEYLYQARRSGDAVMAQNRFDIGKGIRANYLTFELYNGGGADFELESVEFIAVPTDRRI